MGFKKPIAVSGQTYTRKLDFMVLSTLSAIAQSANKMAIDIRLLANMKVRDCSIGLPKDCCVDRYS